MSQASERSIEMHFAFGENWASYADRIGDREIAEAENGLRKLLEGADLSQDHFLDIGCGSGIHSLAAKRLGAKRVVALDLDPISVATTQRLLQLHLPTDAGGCEIMQRSVFDLDPQIHGRFTIVYSWGVLHHTGDMHNALRKAAAMVAPGGLFVFALYRRTLLCPFWRREKRWYAKAPPARQQLARRAYFHWTRFIFRLKGIDLDKHIREYHSMRGMDFWHDVHDWLGGYPYESVLPAAVDALMKEMGLSLSRRFLVSPKPGLRMGLLGSSCDQYVYQKTLTTVEAD